MRRRFETNGFIVFTVNLGFLANCANAAAHKLLVHAERTSPATCCSTPMQPGRQRRADRGCRALRRGHGGSVLRRWRRHGPSRGDPWERREQEVRFFRRCPYSADLLIGLGKGMEERGRIENAGGHQHQAKRGKSWSRRGMSPSRVTFFVFAAVDLGALIFFSFHTFSCLVLLGVFE